MEKLLDALSKYVPAPVMVAVLGMAVGFLGIHYWRGFRDYSDTLRDRMFLSLVTVVVAGGCLYAINRRPVLPVSGLAPILLVPYFDGDERDQFRTAFSSQLERAFARAGERRPVFRLPAYLAEQESAMQSAQRYGASAAIYGPKVIRDKDTVKLCFHIAMSSSNSTTTFPLVPVEMPVVMLEEIANTLLTVGLTGGTVAAANPVLSRLQVVEAQLAALRASIDERAKAGSALPAPKADYRRKFAIVTGVNEIPGTGFALRFAESDGRAMADALSTYGFETTLLVGKEATRGRVLAALDEVNGKASPDDLVVFYYGGNSTAAIEGGKEKVLRLYLADTRLEDERSAITIRDLRARLDTMKAKHRLAIIDGCHGTTGLDVSPASAGLATEASPSGPILQFFAASGDDEFAMESADAGGGSFTQALVGVLKQSARDGGPLWMHTLVAKTTTLVRAGSNGRQTPKLVTVSGIGEIHWSPAAAATAPTPQD
jgi:hypothetical protein